MEETPRGERERSRSRKITTHSQGGEKMKKVMVFGILMLAILLVQVNVVSANKSEASIEGPTDAAKGSEVTLRITATHNANTASHYTEWLKVTANGKQIARWDYTKENRPDGAVFTKEIKIKMTEDTEIVAESSCNNHGSKGPVKHKIIVK
jgi:desulfoferrodoxin (superoxide reductase-like protein)